MERWIRFVKGNRDGCHALEAGQMVVARGITPWPSGFTFRDATVTVCIHPSVCLDIAWPVSCHYIWR